MLNLLDAAGQAAKSSPAFREPITSAVSTVIFSILTPPTGLYYIFNPLKGDILQRRENSCWASNISYLIYLQPIAYRSSANVFICLYMCYN